VATYDYGHVTTADGKSLHYEKVPINFGFLPDEVGEGVGTSLRSNLGYANVPGGGSSNPFWVESQQLQDVNGDGRADFLYRNGNKTWVAYGNVDAWGDTTFDAGHPWFQMQGSVLPTPTDIGLSLTAGSPGPDLDNDTFLVDQEARDVHEDTYRLCNIDVDG